MPCNAPQLFSHRAPRYYVRLTPNHFPINSCGTSHDIPRTTSNRLSENCQHFLRSPRHASNRAFSQATRVFQTAFPLTPTASQCSQYSVLRTRNHFPAKCRSLEPSRDIPQIIFPQTSASAPPASSQMNNFGYDPDPV